MKQISNHPLKMESCFSIKVSLVRRRRSMPVLPFLLSYNNRAGTGRNYLKKAMELLSVMFNPSATA